MLWRNQNSLWRIRRFLICKISTLSVSDFMKPVKSNPSQAAEQWYDMAIVTHNQIFMKCYIFKSHHLMLEESGFTCKRWFPLSQQVTAQQHTAPCWKYISNQVSSKPKRNLQPFIDKIYTLCVCVLWDIWRCKFK